PDAERGERLPYPAELLLLCPIIPRGARDDNLSAFAAVRDFERDPAVVEDLASDAVHGTHLLDDRPEGVIPDSRPGHAPNPFPIRDRPRPGRGRMACPSRAPR